MNDAEMDKLLERGLSGGPPRSGFREEVLADSVAAFIRVRRTRARWRATALAAAAVVIAGVSFLLGRYPPAGPGGGPGSPTVPVARDGQSVVVPGELVAWLEAAGFFKQLGMEERMTRAYERASELLSENRKALNVAAGPVLARGGGIERPKGRDDPSGMSDLPESVAALRRVMAQSLGD